jgi:hypothetical protein
MTAAFRAWPRRRWATALLALPLTVAAFTGAAGVTAQAAGAGWSVLLLLAAAAGSLTLASYVPRRGLRPDVGCSPCAAVSGLTLVGALIVLDGYGAHVSGPLLALAVTTFGLAQRLGQQPTCATG